LWEKWQPAERIYREFLNDRRSSDAMKAAALCALATATQHQERWPEAKTYYQQIVDEYGGTPSAQRAMLALGLESRATVEQRAERLQRAYEMNPNSPEGERALWQIGFMYFAEKRPEESLKALNQFISRYPRSRFVPHAKLFIEKQQ